jgi:hypothetical protein
MAKLHSEIRIKSVDITLPEGAAAGFGIGDIVYDTDSGKFKICYDNGGSNDWQDAVTGVSADLSATSASALADINYNSVTLDNANGGGKILAWNESLQAWAPIDPVSGATDQIIEGDTKVEVVDSGSDGRIGFLTENTLKWEITTDGHILPGTNDTFDIGSAEKKVRDFYLSNNSLWIGDEHKISIDNGVMKFRRRKYEAGDVPATWQSVWNAYTDADAFTWTSAAIVGLIDGNSGSGAPSIYSDLGDTPSDLAEMTLAHWERAIGWMKKVAAGTIGSDANINAGSAWLPTAQPEEPFPNGIQSLFAQDDDFVDNFKPGESADGFKGSTGRTIGANELSGGDDISPAQEGKGLSGITYSSESHKEGPITFHVGVDNKSAAHPYTGLGSTLAYYINGQESPFLKLKKGLYHFDVSHASNAGHPFKLYTAADKSGGLWSSETGGADNPSGLNVEFWNGGSQITEADYNNGVGAPGTYLKVSITSDAPQILHYQCSAHALMGYELKNESAVISGGGATSSDELSDMSTADAQDGEALVYNSAQSRFEPQPIMTRSGAFVSRRISFSADGASSEIIQLHPDIENKSGGRIVIDTANLGNNAGDKVQLNLHQLYVGTANPTMNFEIYSIGI